MKVALVPSAPCDWRSKGRLLGRVELSPCDDDSWFDSYVQPLEPLKVARVLHGPDDLSKGLAKRIAKRFGGAVKEADDLVEVDLGLWAGLTEEDLRKRFGRAYRQLYDDPMSVNPPNGEPFATAAERIRKALEKRLKKTRGAKDTTVLVLRPLAFALARCILGGEDQRRMWEFAEGPDASVLAESPPAAPPAAAGREEPPE